VRATVTPEVAARSAYQDQQAEGLITLDELQTKLAALEEARAVARRELAALKEHRERIGHLEKDANALLEHYAGMVPEALDDLTSEERHRVYKMMRLNVIMYADGLVEVTGAFGGLSGMPGRWFL
jgi:flagellar motility protein MotE (MotC chaperone)